MGSGLQGSRPAPRPPGTVVRRDHEHVGRWHPAVPGQARESGFAVAIVSHNRLHDQDVEVAFDVHLAAGGGAEQDYSFRIRGSSGHGVSLLAEPTA